MSTLTTQKSIDTTPFKLHRSSTYIFVTLALEKGRAAVSEEEQEKHADNHGKGIRSLSAGMEFQISPISGQSLSTVW